MKKSLFFCSALAVLALVSGCKKDQETVTLGVSLEQNSKVYIDDDNYPCWSEGDQVHVNGQHDLTVSGISTNGRSAQITGVTGSNSGYTVVYPSSFVAGDANFSGLTSVPVTLPLIQKFETDVNGHQKVALPMGGVNSSTNMTLHNLCSILRLTVRNASSSAIDVERITVEASNAYLSGSATATLSGDNPAIVATGSKIVTLAKEDNSAMVTGIEETPATFDIVLPAFSTASNITVTVYTSNGYQVFTTNNHTLNNNTIVTYDVSVDESATAFTTAAKIKCGWSFREGLSANRIQQIVFLYPGDGGYVVFNGNMDFETGNSQYNIKGQFDYANNVLTIKTDAEEILAIGDCSEMFDRFRNLTSIDFGSGFNTKNVTKMNGMFFGCSSLQTINLSSFNTSNVEDMNNMFAHCSSLTELNLSNFNTSNVGRMNQMFDGCTGMQTLRLDNFDMGRVYDKSWMFNNLATTSGACTIYCSQTALDALQNGTNLPTSVHFNWVTPSK